jgi:glycosyltransferase involved in cell wall biosynthesis
VLCAPSQTTLRWREQFGRMLSEAMACGVPVVASRSGEIPYVVGDAGILLPENDVEAWASALTKLLTHSAARRALGEKGMQRARVEFAWPVVARRHLDFFDELTSTS